jgi:phosphoglycolate phosphatase-like HAD superfamily hydrolase
MIGDMKTDVLASRAAGVGAIAVSYGYGKVEDLKEVAPDYILGDLRELEKVIEL